MNHKYSYQEAERALKQLVASDQKISMDQVRDVISRIDAGSGEGKTTVLYTGNYDDIKAYKAAEDFSDQFPKEAHTLHRTDVGKFIADENKLLTDVITKAEGLDLNFQVDVDKLNDLINRPNDGLWAIASTNLASSAEGNVIVFTSEANPDRIFGQDELKELLKENSKVTPCTRETNSSRLFC